MLFAIPDISTRDTSDCERPKRGVENSTGSGMEEGADIGGVIAGLAFLIAGVRLSRLSLQTGQAPERLLAVTFLVWSVSYFVWEIPIILGSESVTLPCFFAGRLLNDIGVVTFVLFLRLVFRSQERWAW